MKNKPQADDEILAEMEEVDRLELEGVYPPLLPIKEPTPILKISQNTKCLDYPKTA